MCVVLPRAYVGFGRLFEMFIEYVVQGADYTRSHLYYNELINLAFLGVILFNVSGVRLARAGDDSIWARSSAWDS